jgi:hypothetical protein
MQSNQPSLLKINILPVMRKIVTINFRNFINLLGLTEDKEKDQD